MLSYGITLWLHSLFPGTFGLWGSLLARGSTLVSTRYQSPVNSDRGIQEGSIILYVALSLDLFISYDRQMLWYTCVGSGRQLTAAVDAYFCGIDSYCELEIYWMDVVQLAYLIAVEDSKYEWFCTFFIKYPVKFTQSNF